MNVFDGLVYACVHVCMHMLLSMCTYWNARGDEKGNEGWAEAQAEEGGRRSRGREEQWGECIELEVGGERGLRLAYLQQVQDIASFSKHSWVTASTQGGVEIISEKPLSDQEDSEHR